MAPRTFWAMSGGISVMPCAFLACVNGATKPPLQPSATARSSSSAEPCGSSKVRCAIGNHPQRLGPRSRLGDDVARITGKDGGQVRGNPDLWQAGKFVHPHDACFDHEGNIYVAEWVATGRVSKLRRVG